LPGRRLGCRAQPGPRSGAFNGLPLRGFPIVVIQQPAQALLAADRREGYGGRFIGGFALAASADGPFIVETLVWTFVVIMLDELVDKIVQVPFAEDDEEIQAFLPDRLDEPLDERDGVG